MNIKKIVIVAGILLVVSLVGYFLMQQNAPQELTSTRTPLPESKVPSAELNLPTGETMKVRDQEIKNVYKTAIAVNKDGNVLFSETNSYQESYDPNKEFFTITVLGTPFETARREAEQQFLRSLGITEEAACKLKVHLGTPLYANPAESGKNYKLSFCE